MLIINMTPIKNVVSVLLIFSITAGVLHFDELSKLPALLRHFKEHKQEQASVTFGEFLFVHYLADNDKTKSDQLSHENPSCCDNIHVTKVPGEPHSKLPFKSEKKLHSHLGYFAFAVNHFTLAAQPVVLLHFVNTGTRCITGFSAIWQPPKIG
jgi:hypothetical protein